jgi:hypothetical protein
LTWIPALLKRKKSRKLKVLLLGDIVDLIRTERWLEVDADERPWGRNGLRDVDNGVRHAGGGSDGGLPDARSVTEQRCLGILGEIDHIDEKGESRRDTILSRNREAFRVFRDEIPAEMGRAGIGFELVYLPGNHDRLCNLYPSLRDRLKTALGLSMGSGGEEWWYPYHFESRAVLLLRRQTELLYDAQRVRKGPEQGDPVFSVALSSPGASYRASGEVCAAGVEGSFGG